ncbi:MAG: class II aldolase/adducin family protein [Lautropia sp.]
MQQQSSLPNPLGVPAGEWQVRVDLAAAHRLACMHGLNEAIFNHLTAVVPGKPGRYYQIPFGLHWSEVTASSFMELDFEGKVLRGEGEPERSSICIHAPIHRLAPQAACVFHTHMPFASALTRLEDQTLKPIGQTETILINSIAYDDHYPGPAFELAEGERLARVLGDKNVLFMANHGVVTVGETVSQAYELLYYIERAAQVQIYAMWTGRPLRMLPKAVIERTAGLVGAPAYYGQPNHVTHFAALKRMLDRREPDYKT